MGKSINLPLTETEVEASTEGGIDYAKVIIGFALLFVAGVLGLNLGQSALGTLAQTLGIEVADQNTVKIA